MCVLHAGPGGIISQHPACHRLQQGGRAAEGIQGWKVIAWSHKSEEHWGERVGGWGVVPPTAEERGVWHF